MATSILFKFLNLQWDIQRTIWRIEVSDGSFFFHFCALSFEINLFFDRAYPLTLGHNNLFHSSDCWRCKMRIFIFINWCKSIFQYMLMLWFFSFTYKVILTNSSSNFQFHDRYNNLWESLVTSWLRSKHFHNKCLLMIQVKQPSHVKTYMLFYNFESLEHQLHVEIIFVQ